MANRLSYVIVCQMSELHISKIEKKDIKAPCLRVGSSAIAFERHEKYIIDPDAENAGSLVAADAMAAFERNAEFFHDVFGQDAEHDKTMVLFVSSDTQYAGKGYRSMETAQLAQNAAIRILEELGMDPHDRIINFNPHFSTNAFHPSAEAVPIPVRPDPRLREPQIFAMPEYVDFLIGKYNEEGEDTHRLGTKAWAAHENDVEKAKREELGAEGVYDILERTKTSLAIMERYSKVFHANNKNVKLIIWVDSHYDTISPLVKDAAKIGFDNFLPVDYGAGVIIELEPGESPTLSAQNQRIALQLGSMATGNVSP